MNYRFVLLVGCFGSLSAAAADDTSHNFADTSLYSRQSWRQIQEMARDTVVQVFAHVAEVDIMQPYKTPTQYGSRGSGFFINESGHIITNAHVVDQAHAIWIQIPSLGKRLISVTVVGVCPERDIAHLRVTDEDVDYIRSELGAIPYLTLGDSDKVRRSDEVLALGYPLGQESLKSTTGVISGREKNLIQMSAPINLGSSGGPLLNRDGEVIGITSSGILEAQNVGYITPINEVHVIKADLETTPLLRKPTLGIFSMYGTPELTRLLGNPHPGGCYAVEVVKDSLLDKGGVRRGDMIYEINGYRLDIYGEMKVPWSEDKITIADFTSRLALGDEVNLTIYRHGERIECHVIFEQNQLLPIRRIYPGYEPIEYEIFGGMVVMQLTLNHVKALINQVPGLSKYCDIKNQLEPVLIVTHIFPNSQLFRSRTLLVGVTLHEINGIPVTTLDDFRAAIGSPVNNTYFTIKATDNVTRSSDHVFVVLAYNKVLEEELTLSTDFRYPLSDAVQTLLATRNT